MLDITAISKTFHPGTPNARQALRQLSLHLEDGEFATIVGSNGAGKSTLFGAIAGSFYADEGRILLDGTDLTFQPEHQRSRVIGRSRCMGMERVGYQGGWVASLPPNAVGCANSHLKCSFVY